jgi:hypothetical protein
MSLTAQNLMDRASLLLNDVNYTRWASPELLAWLNDGRRAAAVLRPDIYAETTSHALSAGAKQSVPSDGIRLIDVSRNTNGNAVTPTEKMYLDQQNPNWPAGTQSGTIRHWMFDPRNPMFFWVWPPANSNASLEIIYQQVVTDYGATDALTTYEALYDNSFINYMCHRAFLKDSEVAANAERASAYYTLFKNELEAGAQVTMTITSNSRTKAGEGR